MKGAAYWINPTGKILNVGGTKHIDQIIKAPEKFGFTFKDIEELHEKYGERIGMEGKAREELIKEAMRKDFIRIRLYPNVQWSVNLWRLTSNAEKALMIWAKEASKNRMAGPHMPVKILEFKTQKSISTTPKKLMAGVLEGLEGYEPIFVNSVYDFETLKIINFKEFLYETE